MGIIKNGVKLAVLGSTENKSNRHSADSINVGFERFWKPNRKRFTAVVAANDMRAKIDKPKWPFAEVLLVITS